MNVDTRGIVIQNIKIKYIQNMPVGYKLNANPCTSYSPYNKY